MEKDYAVVEVVAGETSIELVYEVKIAKYIAHPWVGINDRRVAVNAGRVVVKRGPVLYCCEKAVESLEALDPQFTNEAPVLREDGIIEMKADDGTVYELIEYRKWNNNGPMPMRVWLRQEGVTQDLCDLTGWEGKLYREYVAY